MTNLIATLHQRIPPNAIIQWLIRSFSGNVLSIQETELDESGLASQAARDPQAFDALYRAYVNRVYAYHLVRTGSREEAEDLTSLTFLAALEGIKGYRHQSSFPVWLFSIARRKLADHYRRSTLPEIDMSEYPTGSLEETVDQRLWLEQVTRALTSINHDRVEALCLRFFGELNTLEISNLLSKSEGAVRNLIYRALQDLRGQLAAVEEMEES